ncbi:MAG: PUR family DNA/RNA-binding protein [Flavobacteriales bacterium]|jgi:hypothetical protein|nr:PUR family DNA/RNA-binding protein [Flavobacteriales bacterium]PWM10776.1 MAG: DNA-binding protein [Flavobacteriales bacterium]
MGENEYQDNTEIFSKALRAGRRTYFFDVRTTKAGDYYLTITESKKFSQESGVNEYKKHKIYLYKEDFESFKSFFEEATDFILKEKGQEVISERHIKDYKKTPDDIDAEHAVASDREGTQEDISLSSRFTNIEFEDI